MFESIGSFFKKIMKPEQKELLVEATSKDAAKERLHIVLMQDRANVSADFLELMKQEIIDVIKKYIVVDEEQIDVRLTNQENDDGTTGAPSLYANIPILNIRNDIKGEVLNAEEVEEAIGIKHEKSIQTENDELDDDVTFDDLLRVAEKEEKNKKSYGELEDLRKLDSSNGIEESKIADNSSNIEEAKILDNSNDIEEIKTSDVSIDIENIKTSNESNNIEEIKNQVEENSENQEIKSDEISKKNDEIENQVIDQENETEDEKVEVQTGTANDDFLEQPKEDKKEPEKTKSSKTTSKKKSTSSGKEKKKSSSKTKKK